MDMCQILAVKMHQAAHSPCDKHSPSQIDAFYNAHSLSFWTAGLAWLQRVYQSRSYLALGSEFAHKHKDA